MSQEETAKSTQSNLEDEIKPSSNSTAEELNEELDDSQLDAVAGGDAGTDKRQQDIEKWGG